MVSELTAISGVINLLTGLNGLPATIVEVVVTLLVNTAYKSALSAAEVSFLRSTPPSVALGQV